LIGEVDESAVVQASEKARRIPPAGSWPRRAVEGFCSAEVRTGPP
jgi:hypothetical protein